MKSKLLLFLLAISALMALVACKTMASPQPTTQTTEPGISKPDVGTGVEKMSVADCPKTIPGAHQLIDASRGVCFLYPDAFDFFEYGEGSGYVMFIESLMANHKSPVIWITFEPANGRLLEEVTSQRLADYAFPETQSQAITLGGEPASLLDNLPGQDTNRRVVAVHDDRVIDIVIDHIGENYGAAGEQAEAAYRMITTSFQFIGVDPEASIMLDRDATLICHLPLAT